MDNWINLSFVVSEACVLSILETIKWNYLVLHNLSWEIITLKRRTIAMRQYKTIELWCRSFSRAWKKERRRIIFTSPLISHSTQENNNNNNKNWNKSLLYFVLIQWLNDFTQTHFLFLEFYVRFNGMEIIPIRFFSLLISHSFLCIHGIS